VTGFGRNDGSFVWWENTQRRLRFQAERIERRWLVVTLGILRCGQNDGKDLMQQNNGNGKQRQQQQQ
jgi:hypothetical protein